MRNALYIAANSLAMLAIPALCQGVVSFQPWSQLPEGITTEQGLGGASFRGNIHLFAVDFNHGQLHENIKYGAAWWRGWRTVDDRFRTRVAPAAVTYNGQLFLFHTGRDGTIYVSRKSSSDEAWSAPEPIPGLVTNVAPFAVVYLGKIYLFAVRAGVNNVLLSRYPDPAFSPWAEVPGDGRTQQAVGGTVFQDYESGEGSSLYLYVSGLDTGIWQQKYSTSRGWGGWSPFGGPSTKMQVTSASVMRPTTSGGPPDSRYRYQTLFHKSLDDKPYLNHRGFDFPNWFGFFPMGAGALTRTPITPVVHNNQIYAYIAGFDMRIWEAVQSPLRPYPY